MTREPKDTDSSDPAGEANTNTDRNEDGGKVHHAECPYCGTIAENSDLVFVEAQADEHEAETGHDVPIEHGPDPDTHESLDGQ